MANGNSEDVCATRRQRMCIFCGTVITRAQSRKAQRAYKPLELPKNPSMMRLVIKQFPTLVNDNSRMPQALCVPHYHRLFNKGSIPESECKFGRDLVEQRPLRHSVPCTPLDMCHICQKVETAFSATISRLAKPDPEIAISAGLKRKR